MPLILDVVYDVVLVRFCVIIFLWVEAGFTMYSEGLGGVFPAYRPGRLISRLIMYCSIMLLCLMKFIYVYLLGWTHFSTSLIAPSSYHPQFGWR